MVLYKDSVIEVKIITDKSNKSLKSIALKYVTPCTYRYRNGGEAVETNAMGGETDWFILPHTFGAVVGRKLFEQYNAGLCGFNKKAVKILKDWLIDMEIISDAMCY
jgi:hypothetical protein